MKITIDEQILRDVLYHCVSDLLGREFQITEVDGNLRTYANRIADTIRGESRRLSLVDRVIAAVAFCHDDSALWKHLREDPDAFRVAVRQAIRAFGSDACRSSEVEGLLSIESP